MSKTGIYLVISVKSLLNNVSSSFQSCSETKKSALQGDVMATEENQTQAGHEILAQPVPPPSTGKSPNRKAKHANNGQEAWSCSDQMWLSKQRSSPSLLLYRKLSSDSMNGTILDEEYEDLNYSSKVLSTKEKLFAELSTGTTKGMTPVSEQSSEGPVWQLDTPRDVVGAGGNETGSPHWSCALSSIYTSPDTYSCHSPRSSPSPSSSPVQSHHPSSSPSCPNKRHIRRGSLPVSMLAFHKVIKEGSILWWQLHNV